MQTICVTLGALIAGLLTVKAVAQTPPTPSNPVEYREYKDWRVLSLSHRTDKNTLRIIVGNDIAVQAARSGKTQP